MKICTVCKVEKELSCFNIRRASKDGLQSRCRTCRAEQKKVYREANREQIAEQQKTYQKANRKRLAEYTKVYRKTPKGKAVQKAAMQRYYLNLDLATAGRVTQRALSAWAVQVKQRDQCCQVCGSTKKLEAHHVLPKNQFPELALELSNGITLCKFHHAEHHMLNGY